MKQHYSRWHRLALLLLTLAFAMLGGGCSRPSSAAQPVNKKSPLVGKYTLLGEREAASEIELYANGTFEYAMVYGGNEEGAAGTWTSTDKQVVLNVDKRQQGKTMPPLSDKIELRRDGDKLVWNRNDNELVYLKGPSSIVTDDTGKPIKTGKDVKVDIVGYNYTDRYIQSFSVNGHGGGNIFLSSPTSGGGGPFCCFYYTEGRSFPYEVKVEWANSASEGPWKTAKALIPEPQVANPTRLEVHIYQDGHVEAALTDSISDPRLKLPKKNENER